MRHLDICIPSKVLILFLAIGVAIQFSGACKTEGGKGDSLKVVHNIVEDFPFTEPIEETVRIDFSSDRASASLLDGWGGRYAGGGLWATDLSSRLRFFSFRPGLHQKTIVRCAPYLGPRSREQQMEVYLNEIEGQEPVARLNLEADSREYALVFPAERIKRGENIITFRYSHLERLESDESGEERKEPRAVHFDWLRFPDAASSRKHIYREEDSIFINPLATLLYHLRIPDEGRLGFELRFLDQPSAADAGGGAPIFSVFIQGEGSARERVFEERMSADSTSRKRREVDLSEYAGRIMRLSFQLEFPETSGIAANALYAEIGRPSVEGYVRRSSPPGASQSRLTLEGIEKSNLIFIILDAANPTHFGSYGYERDTTPNMDRLAEEGVLFSRAFAHAPNTRASTASLFTSTYPPTHRVIARDTMLSDSAVSWAEDLRDAGIRTFAATSNIQASPVFNLLQGFDETVELYKDKKGGVILAQEFLKPAGEWIEKNRSEQFFMYLHVLQPHAPYNPPPPAAGTFSSGYEGPLKDVRRLNPRTISLEDLGPRDREYIIAKYDENLLYADAFVEDLTDLLRRRGLLENTILLVTADHGEAFHTHGHIGHSSSVYDDEIRIPLIMRFPLRYNLGGKKIDAVVQSIDLMPTFLDLLGIQHSGHELQGRSLLPAIFDPSQEIHEDIATFFGRLSPDGTQVASALRGERYKFFEFRSRRFLFDLQADPTEQDNLYLTTPVIAGYYVQRLKKLQAEWSEGESLAGDSKINLDENIKEQLRSLGYIK